MGVQGWYRILREEGYVPETAPCCSFSLWRPSDNAVMDSIGANLEKIPNHSELLLDGNGLAFYWHRVAYARHVASICKRNRRKENCCVKLKNANLTPTEVRRLLPNFMPLSQLSAVVNEFVKTLRDKHHMKITVYWDGRKRRVYKHETDEKRQAKIPEEWSNLHEYCDGILPIASTVCAWETMFPKSRLFQAQIIHTLDNLQVPSEHCNEEADSLIAKAARGNPNAFIVGLDSDFCFFPDVQYIPLNTLDAAGHFTTGVVLRRRALAESVGLSSESLMTELAILLGNDFVHPSKVELDYQGGKHTTDVLSFLQNQEPTYRVTSISEDVEETLRFVRSLYELQDMDEYPFEGDACDKNMEDGDDDNDAGDEILHLVSSPGSPTLDRLAIPPEVPREICTVNPFLDTSAKDAVLRCLQRYLDMNLEHCLINKDHLEALRKLPLDSSQAQLVQKGDWRPLWEDMEAAYLIEKLVAVTYEKKNLITRMLPPFAVFDSQKFHAHLRLERGQETSCSSKTSTAKTSTAKNMSSNGPPKKMSEEKKTKTKTEKTALPIDEHEGRIMASIKKNRVTIIQGDTGCGKSSRVPVMIMRSPAPDPTLRKVKLYMSQPRRIAAKGLVERVRAVEPDLRDQIALRMGHGVREYETKSTRAWFVTTGYLVRVMANNMESLRDVSHLIIDEVHERSVDTDILCLLCRRLLQRNSHVRLVLMSATLAANLYQEYFGSPEPPLVVGAKRYPVTEVFLDDLVAQNCVYKLPAKVTTTARNLLEECNKMKCIRTPSLSYMEKVFTVLTSLVATISVAGSSVLVFVPGMNEIISISELIDQMFVPGKRFTCIPVHSDIPFEDQMKVFVEADEDECRVILATNSAESSVTLPALNHVICLGLAKQITYNELSHRQMLEPVWISRASATQRAGRTGRIAPGTVFRLYSRECYDRHMTSFEPGEMIRIPLDSVILTLKEMLGDDERVTDVLHDCIEPPNMNTIERSYRSLHESHFVTSPDDESRLTNLGTFALSLGIDLTLGSLIGLGIQFGIGREAIQMASIFSFPKTPWQIPNPMLQSPNEFNSMMTRTFASRCDFDADLYSEPMSIMNLLWEFDKVGSNKKKEWCWKNGISFPRISRISSTISNVLQRVAIFLKIPAENLEMECPPSEMPQAKVALLRIIQAWVFHDTMIACKIKQDTPPEAHVKLLPSSDPVDETVLDTLFIRDRHDYVLIDPKEVEQRVKWITTSKVSLHEYSAQTERRALSYAVEKHIGLVCIWIESKVALYFSSELAVLEEYSCVMEKTAKCLSTAVRLVGEESKKNSKRGIGERACGKWSFLPSGEFSDHQCFLKFTNSMTEVPRKKIFSLLSDIERLVASQPRLQAITIDASKIDSTGRTKPTHVTVVSRGSHAREVSGPDLKDLVGATGSIEVKTKKKSGIPLISFPSTPSPRKSGGKSSSPHRAILSNTPEAFRLLSVMASRRRTHNVTIQLDLDDEVDELSDSDIHVQIYPDPKVTKLSYRWTRFNSDGRVFVEENSPIASATPVGWTGTMYCCCANTLEIKGGALKAEGLTLLPLGRMFFMLSRVSFGLVKGDLSNEDTLQMCLKWISQDTKGALPDDTIKRLEAAAAFHNSFDAGEALECLPSSVECLLGIFDGLHGLDGKLWDSFSQDPFIPHRRQK